jgi:hypothetical protein
VPAERAGELARLRAENSRAGFLQELQRKVHGLAVTRLPEQQELILTYHVRVVAEGLTMRGALFTRAQSFTAVALPGGDNPPPGPSGDDGRLCDLLTCLTKVSAKALERNGINPEEILRCVQQHCAHEEAGVPR